jgi:glucose/mannose-6-phosphate isomerase
MEKRDYELILDDVGQIRAADPQNMYNRIFDLPEHMAKALKLAEVWKIQPEDFADVRNVVVIGMGGSAIAGEMVRSYLSGKLLIPFQICRDYTLPEYVDDETLVIASSYSGNTEETLSALDDALARKALIVAITTGGMMEDVAKINDIPIMNLPTGLQPRAALGYSFVPTLMFFDKIGMISSTAEEIAHMVQKLEKLREKYIEDNPTLSNPAKRLAGTIFGKIPIIYSGPSLTDAVALRWKGQISENGKNLAFANQFPEMNHNELVGWSKTVEAYRDNLIVIFLRDVDDHPKVRRRMNIVKDVIEKLKVQVVDLHSMGETKLERMFSLVQMGDFISYYLAVLNEVDPTPVDVIESLKKQLADTK